ncbi:MAG: carbohydrate kinase family protein [Clostridia bacterium]|nr:carbohydrate kinase family protein [Clostridia bacterium]
MSGIAVAGSVLVDKINRIKVFPREGDLVSINDIQTAVGGCVPNVGVDLKKIGVDIPVYAYGKIGKDDEGKYLKEVLEKENVITDGISYSDDKTSKTEVMSVPGGQRTFFTYPGASKDFGFDDIDFDNFSAEMLHLGYFLLLKKVDEGDGLKILREAKRRGIKTSIDLVSQPSESYDKILECLKFTDNLIINEVEAGFLTGMTPENKNLVEIAKRLFSLGVGERVIIHLPEWGVCVSKRGVTVLPSYDFPKEKIAGTTGAGDAFCAGALIGIYKGYSDKKILELASAAAVTALTGADATSGVKTEEEINEYCKSFNRRNICL